MGIDVISSDSPLPPEPSPGSARAASKGTMLTALVAVGSLVLVAGAAAVAFRAFNHTGEPESLVPSSAFAFARVNLDLPGGQSAATARLAGHFPGSPTRHGSGSPRDRLLRAMFADTSDPHVDYDKEVRPWLGDHAAIAGWLDVHGHPQMEIVLQVRNGSSGRAQVRRLLHRSGHDAPGVAFSDGFAVLAQTDRDAAAAVAAAKRSSLADVTTFRSDIAALPGPQAAVGWADGAGVRRALRSSIGPMFDQQLRPMFGLGVGNLFAGHVAAGVRVTSDYVELDVRSVGRNTSKTAPSSLLTRLPDNTIGALEVGDPSALVTGMTAMFSRMFAYATPHMSLQGHLVAPPIGVHAYPVPAPEAAGARTQATPSPGVTFCSANECSTQSTARPPAPPNPLAQIRRYTGLTFPGDVKTLLGNGAVVAYGGVQLTGAPKVALVTRPGDVSAARALADRLAAALGHETGMTPTVDSDGADLVLATTPDYAAAVKTGGTFGSQTQVHLALGDVPSSVMFAGYLDLSSIWPLAGSHVPRDVTHLHAIGFWATADQDVQRFQLRAVIG